jgi:hypothetical protein
MKMLDFHCEMLELSLSFSSNDFDESAFLTAAKVERKEDYIDEDGDFVMSMSFDTHDESSDYHAHMVVLLMKNGQSRIDIRYHDSRIEKSTSEAPYAEDCARWIGSFFKIDELVARIAAGYEFDNSFSPIICLPFPLVSTEKTLAGSLVTGLSILFPREKGPENIIIEVGSEGSTGVFLKTRSELKLKEFNLNEELKRLSASVNSLIRKQKAINENQEDSR